MSRLHHDTTPITLALLTALLAHHSDRQDLGYLPDESGADIDWDRLTAGRLSTTEIATAHIARGCAMLERRGGGLPVRLGGPVRAAVNDITTS